MHSEIDTPPLLAALIAPRLALPLLGLVAAAMLAFGWVGFLGIDDASYALAAQEWLADPLHVGTNHWALRHPLVLPIATSFKAFGVSEGALQVPSTASYVLLVLLTYAFLGRALGRAVGLVGALLVATTPLIVISGTTVFVDGMELVWVALSFWLYESATRRNGPGTARLWFASGAAAGVAWLCRETTAGLLLAYGLFLLLGFGQRRQFLWLAAGFVLVWGAELAFLWIQTGDPWHRLAIDLHHDEVKRAAKGVGVDKVGNLTVHPLVNPLLVLFLNQEFALLYWFAFPLGVWAATGRSFTPRERGLARKAWVLALAWGLFQSVASGQLLLIPRYFGVTTYAAVALVAIAVVRGLAPRAPRRAALVCGALITANCAGVWVENKDYFAPERALLRLATESPGEELLYTDPFTRLRIEFPLARQAAGDRVRGAPPPAGALFYFIPKNVDRGRAGRTPFARTDYEVKPDWTVLGRFDASVKLSDRLLQTVGFDRRPEPAVLYRAGRERDD